VLVEFALIALLLILLLAAILDFGRAMYAGQVLQQAADLAARELAHASLPADSTLEAARARGDVRLRIFDDEKLVLDPATNVGDLPAVNQALYSLMIADQVTLDGSQRQVLRYPGAILRKPNGAFTVGIPVVTARDDTGTETIHWAPVLEEIKPADQSSPFSVLSRQRGLAAVRINYPFQAAALSGFREGPGAALEPANVPIQANDAGVHADNSPPGGATPVDPGQAGGPYAGPYGLGRQFALAQTIRPFRKLLSAQAVYRREIFAEASP
jgi:hypothetical protein